MESGYASACQRQLNLTDDKSFEMYKQEVGLS